ncbi:MAG TPA: hypothetical protein VN965_03380 [Candidatus Dormibacteraeota bacterium]|nr:hypothetical protein [Candidatus Dormibacteraeota bacterium]
MKSSAAAALFFIVVLVAASSCRIPGNAAASTPQPSSSSKATPSPAGPLDAEVPMPAGFPPDVPIYTGARLTAGAAFSANGQTTWGMEWETLDTVVKVQAFYASKLSQGDWTIQISGATNGAFAATFRRKSQTDNSKFAGIVGADRTSGVTKISLSLEI